MPLVNIKPGGAVPTKDGEVNLYESPGLKNEKCFNRSLRVLFVNGMLNAGKDHKESAEALSTVQCCPVVGLYNASQGFWPDLGQCIADKATFALASKEQFQQWFSEFYGKAKEAKPGLGKRDFMYSQLRLNKATQELYGLLSEPTIRREKTHLFAHSQGNLIASNALWAMYYSLGPDSIRAWKVSSFGSPAVGWPPGLNRTDYSFTFDPVGWLNFVPRWSNVKVGGVFAHGFLTYLENMAEFTVNKHRVKMLATFNFDEAGLAAEMIGWGANPLRVWSVFHYLLQHAKYDADDVAYEYVKQLKDAGRLNVIRSMAGGKPDVIQIITKALGGGWVTGSEAELMRLVAGMSHKKK